MTDEERQKLVAEIRQFAPDLSWMRQYQACLEAADEIERLATALFEAQVRLEMLEKEGWKTEYAALAQSNAGPTMRETPSDHSLGLAAQAWCEPETSHKVMDEELCEAFARILDRALAQSDAEPWRCPIGIPPESHNICSAGSCWWCLSDRVKAEPDTDRWRHERWLLIQSEDCLKVLGWDGSEDPPREEWAGNIASEIEDMRAALAQSDAEPQDVRALLAAEKLLDALTTLAQSDAEPDPTKVICPNCTHQFTAISVADQERLRVQSDAEPVRAFAKAVLHGDDEHKAWLIEAAEAFITGKPLPTPRGKGTKQSDAEPVAWRWRYKGPWPWTFIDDRFSVQRLASHNEIEVEPLYTTPPPRPDASVGLIKAADIAESLAQEFERRHNGLKKYSLDSDHRWIDFYPRIAQGCEEAAQAIRACAAERSGK